MRDQRIIIERDGGSYRIRQTTLDQEAQRDWAALIIVVEGLIAGWTIL